MKKCLTLALCALFAATAVSAVAQLPVTSIAVAINNQGQVIGSSGGHAFIWQNGIMTDLTTSSGLESVTGINDRGQVVGNNTSADPYFLSQAFLWQNGVLTYLEPGPRDTRAVDINNNGQVLGVWHYSQPVLWQSGTTTFLSEASNSPLRIPEAINSSGQAVGCGIVNEDDLQALFWHDGNVEDLGFLPVTDWRSVSATDINDHSQIVGWSDDHAFSWQDGLMTELAALPGGSSAGALGINNNGQIVGWSSTSGGLRHAVTWQDWTPTDLGTLPGGLHSGANAINDLGQIVGWSDNADGYQHACIWDHGTITDLGAWDVPEPGSFAALLCGLCGLGAVMRRRY